MASAAMWTSKLGNKFPLAWVQEKDAETQKELKRLRGLKECRNNLCADCGSSDSSWASVTHGVFVCIICSDVHRSVGTHVTKMKGCTGTYLWGPDEIEKMQTVGNRRADEIYGDKKVAPDASKDVKQRFVMDKYDKRLFANTTSGAVCAAVSSHRASALRVPVAAAQPSTRDSSSTCVDKGPDGAHKSATKQQQGMQHAPVAAAAWQQKPSSWTHSGSTVARKVDIPDSFFADLFGDEAAEQKQEQHESSTNTQPPPAMDGGHELDAFLNDALGTW